MSAPKKKTAPKQRQTWPIVAGVIAAVVAALFVVAIVASQSGGDDGEDVSANGAGTASDEPVEQIRPVTVQGEALPPLPEDEGTADEAIGLAAPTLIGKDFAGTDVTIEPGGSPKMIVFVAHWCPHCQKEVPMLVDWINAGEVPEGLEVYAVSTGVNADYPNYPPSEWLAREAWTQPVIADSKGQAAGAAYGVTGYPFFVVVGADGTVKARASGELPQEEIDAIVSQAMAS